MLRQSRIDECGKSVVREVLSIIFKDKNYYMMTIDSPCKDFKDIREVLESHNATYESYKIDDISALKKEMFPLIVQVIQGDVLHFVTVSKIKKDKVVFLDPQFGKMTLTLKEFLYVFTGKVLVLSKKGEKEKIRTYHFLKKIEICFYSVLTLLQCVSLVTLLYFTMGSNTFLPCVVLASVSLILVVLQNGLNIRIRNRMEKDVMLQYLTLTKAVNDYKSMSELISLVIRTTSETCSYIVLAFAVSFLLLVNSVYFSLLLLIAVVFVLLRSVLENEKNATDRYCSIKEVAFLSKIKNNEKYIDEYEASKKRANRYLLLLVLTFVAEIVSTVFFSLAIMNIEKILSINSFIYFCSTSFAFSFALKKVLETMNYPTKKAELINSLSYSLQLVNNKHLL